MNKYRILFISLFGCLTMLGIGSAPTLTAAQPVTSQTVPQSTRAQLEQLAAMNTALLAIFNGHTPEKYQAVQGKPFVTSDQTSGYYVLITEPSSKIWAFVIDVRKAGPHDGSALLKDKLRDTAEYLLTNFLGIAKPNDIGVDLESLDLPPDKQGIARLAVTYTDGFIRPEMITRLHYTNGRTVVLLMGAPNDSIKQGKKVDFHSAYNRMESEAKRIILQTGLSDKLTPSEHYMIWRLRQIFW